MNLGRVIIVNRMIMALIKSKYSCEFPTGYTDPDFRYYKQLDSDNDKAIAILGSGAPSPQKIGIYTAKVRAIVEVLDKNGLHKFK